MLLYKVKLILENVREAFKLAGCKLLSEDCPNAKHKLLYICSCGHEWETNWNNFKSGRRCFFCGLKSRLSKRRKPWQDIVNLFSSRDFILLSESNEYINHCSKLRYICNNGHMACSMYSNIQKGEGCMQCRTEKNRGKGNGNYRHDLTEEDRATRKRDLINEDFWREQVFKRDDYTCAICKKRGGILNAHHLAGWDRAPEKRLEVNNGVTLCNKHHKEFHVRYGYGKNTLRQFLAWLRLLKVGKPLFLKHSRSQT